MNRALWRKAISDAWLQLALSSLLLLAFSWLFVWFMSQMPMGAFGMILKWMPDFLKSLTRVPLADLATRTGQLTILYVHVVTILVCVGWAVGRGSDSISGEIARGTMDLLLVVPVRRVSVMAVPAVIATVGAAVLAASVWAGTALGLLTIDLGEPISPRKYLPGAVNLFAVTFCLTGISTLVSSWNRDRWRTISISGGFYVFSFLLEMLRRVWAWGWWLKYCTFLSAYCPQELILSGGNPAASALWSSGTLLGLGLAAYAAAGVVFTLRDIPAAR